MNNYYKDAANVGIDGAYATSMLAFSINFDSTEVSSAALGISLFLDLAVDMHYYSNTEHPCLSTASTSC